MNGPKSSRNLAAERNIMFHQLKERASAPPPPPDCATGNVSSQESGSDDDSTSEDSEDAEAGNKTELAISGERPERVLDFPVPEDVVPTKRNPER